MSDDRAKSGPTPRQSAVRSANVAKRRAGLAGTAPWPFRVPAEQGPRRAAARSRTPHDQRLAAALRAGMGR